MPKSVVIHLGTGDLHYGLPRVTAQVWVEERSRPEQHIGSLPAAPTLIELYRDWRSLYKSLCDRRPFRSVNELRNEPIDGGLEIDQSGITNVSQVSFEQLSQTLQDALNTWLKSEAFLPIERQLRSQFSRTEEVRVVIETDDDLLRRLPWQRWDFFKDYPKSEMALSCSEYQFRHSTLRPPRQKTRILAVLGNSQGINLEQDAQSLQQLLEAETQFLVNPSRQEFNQQLWDERGWDMLFFAGHSQTEGQTGRIYINENPQHNSLTIAQFEAAIEGALSNGLKLAIFNSCDGLGLATALSCLHIPQVIVMRESVANRVAQEFFKHFLTAFAKQHLSLYLAVRQARRQLQGLEDEFPGASWLPVLCQNPAVEPLTWQELMGQRNTNSSDTHETTNHQAETTNLAAIVFTDVQSFTTKMAADDSHTLRLLDRDFHLMQQICQQYQGRVLKSVGDGLLLYFVSAERAVSCAIAIQTQLAMTAANSPHRDILKHRIGIHLGEVKFRDNDVFGNGVNLAARLQKEAPAEGICLSQTVYEIVKNHLQLPVTNSGRRYLKGIQESVQVYLITPSALRAVEPSALPEQSNPFEPGLEKLKPKLRFFHIWRKSCQQLLVVLQTSVVVAGLVMGIRWLGLLQTWELQAFDRFLQLRPPELPDQRLLIVTITEDDLQLPEQAQRKGSLSDLALAKLLHQLTPLKPRAIGLDVYRDFPFNLMSAQLAAELKRQPNFFAICKVGEPEVDSSEIAPLPNLPSDRQGFSDVVLDADKVLRRHLLFMDKAPGASCSTPYALSTQLAFQYLKAEGISPRYTSQGNLQLGKQVFPRLHKHVGGYQQADTAGYQILLNYRFAQSSLSPAPTVTLKNVLAGRLKSEDVTDRIVLIGVTAPSSKDDQITPDAQSIPGVLIQAQMVSQLISAVKDGRTPIGVWAWQTEILWVWVWAVVGGVLAWRCRSVPWLLGLEVTALGTLGVLCFYGLMQSQWVPLVPTAFVFIITSNGVAFIVAIQARNQTKNLIK